MKLAPLALALTLTASAFSQATFTDPANLRGERVRPSDGRELPVDQGASGLQQLLRRLNTRASILNIVAHPDDEDGGMLTFYSRGLGARVADLSLTRGEGGQNAMTGDFEDALGLLRTQELLANDRYTGVDQMFGTEVDFGFSKTKEEAFAKWTHQRVLYDAVRAIRLFRPLVITATFIGGVTDGHGQHQVSGQIAQEAFVAAADPKVFPDMIAEGILPWQALKVYARVPMQSITSRGLFDYATGQYTPAKFTNYVTGEVTTTQPSVDVVVHEGTPDAILSGPSDPPRSYVQFARIGLGLQKSQIGGNMRIPPAGAFDVAYHRYGSKLANQPAHETSFFDGIDTSISGLAESIPDASSGITGQLQAITEEIKQVSDWNSREDQRTGVPELLADLLNRVDLTIAMLESSTLPAQGKADVLQELHIKRVQVNDALVLSLGLHAEATTLKHGNVLLNPIDATPVRITATTTSKADIGYVMPSEDPIPVDPAWLKVPGAQISPDQPVTQDMGILPHELYDRPYFSRPNIEQPFYDLLGPNTEDLRNAPTSPPVLPVYLYFRYRDVILTLATAPPENIIPPMAVSLKSHAQVLPQGQKTFPLQVHMHSEIGNTNDITLKLSLPSYWTSQPDVIRIKPLPGDSATDFDRTFTVIPEPHFSAAYNAKPSTVGAVVTFRNGSDDVQTFEEGYRPIGYGDLPRTNYFTPATDRIVPVDLKLPSRTRIAYIPGTGDDVPSALASIGLTPAILTVADLTAANLAKYDTVVLGVRTYSAHPDLHGAPTQALLDYARNGGNVVVQYQTAEFTADDAPYPLTLGRDAEKVVDETTPVHLLEPANPLLTTPNRITPADFNNWVEERGHGFLHTWDPHYTALTETHDPGGPETQPQSPQRGGLITTPLGKGRWTYCAFALYRQLPEAVPGAYRLFVNLLNP
ncbi:MAG TPA: PIG-L family deacetylase [Acidobacteriaceae bacterium]